MTDYLIGVQPMTGPTGSIFKMKVTYKGNTNMAVYHIKKDTILTIRRSQLGQLKERLNEMLYDLKLKEEFISGFDEINQHELYAKTRMEENIRSSLFGGYSDSFVSPKPCFAIIESLMDGKFSILTQDEKKYNEIAGKLDIVDKGLPQDKWTYFNKYGLIHPLRDNIKETETTINKIQKSIDTLITLSPEIVECDEVERESLLKRYDN